MTDAGRHSIRLATLVALAAVALPLAAQGPVEYPGLETGKMWTFDQPPLDYWATRYGFRPAADWIEHVRLSTARQPGCTASFVSAGGLVMTNHHCARSCIDAVSREGEDLLSNGFYAARREDERPCPPPRRHRDRLRARSSKDRIASVVQPW